MNYQIYWKSILAVIAIALFTSCGSDSNNANDNSNEERTDRRKPANKTMNVKASEVSSQGCLNLQRLGNRLLRLPQNALVRTTTIDFSVVQGDQAIRPDYVPVLAVGAFEHSQITPDEFTSETFRYSQKGCETVTLDDSPNGTVEYTIIEATDTSVKIATHSDEEITADPSLKYFRQSWNFELIDSRSLRITREYGIEDRCPNHTKHLVQSERVIRWATEKDLETQEEMVDGDYLQLLNRAFVSPPAEIQVVSSEDVPLKPSTLSSISEQEIRVDLQRCPAVRTPPADTEEIPNIGTGTRDRTGENNEESPETTEPESPSETEDTGA